MNKASKHIVNILGKKKSIKATGQKSKKQGVKNAINQINEFNTMCNNRSRKANMQVARMWAKSKVRNQASKLLECL